MTAAETLDFCQSRAMIHKMCQHTAGELDMLAAAVRHHVTPGAVIRMVRDAGGLGERVKQLREMAGLEQMDLADRAELSRGYISRLENGLVPNPKLYDLLRVANALSTTVSDLTGDRVTGGDDEAMIRNILNAKLGSASGDQVSRVLDQLAELHRQHLRASHEV